MAVDLSRRAKLAPPWVEDDEEAVADEGGSLDVLTTASLSRARAARSRGGPERTVVSRGEIRLDLRLRRHDRDHVRVVEPRPAQEKIDGSPFAAKLAQAARIVAAADRNASPRASRPPRDRPSSATQWFAS